MPSFGADAPFSWGVWVSLGGDSFDAWDACFHDAQRSHIGPFFGWLSTRLPAYPDTLNLKTRVHLRDDGCVRPSNWSRRTTRSPWSSARASPPSG